MKHARSLAKLIEPFSGRWVALTADEKTVLSVSSSIKKAVDQAKKKGERQPFLIKSPNAYTAAVFY